MNQLQRSLVTIEIRLAEADDHYLAEILKLCAAEIVRRQLSGYQLVYDVAFEIHSKAAHAAIAAGVKRYLDPPPS